MATRYLYRRRYRQIEAGKAKFFTSPGVTENQDWPIPAFPIKESRTQHAYPEINSQIDFFDSGRWSKWVLLGPVLVLGVSLFDPNGSYILGSLGAVLTLLLIAYVVQQIHRRSWNGVKQSIQKQYRNIILLGAYLVQTKFNFRLAWAMMKVYSSR
jgi:hypothetical protein